MAKRTILYFTIEPETRNRYRAVAALRGKSLKEWALEAMEEKLDREIAGKDRWSTYLQLARQMHPRIAAGTTTATGLDASKVIDEIREDRLRDIGS